MPSLVMLRVVSRIITFFVSVVTLAVGLNCYVGGSANGITATPVSTSCTGSFCMTTTTSNQNCFFLTPLYVKHCLLITMTNFLHFLSALDLGMTRQVIYHCFYWLKNIWLVSRQKSLSKCCLLGSPWPSKQILEQGPYSRSIILLLTYEWASKYRVVVTGKPFQPSIM
jgi:hypothetical protein